MKAVLLALLLSFALPVSPVFAADKAKETAFERVIRTGVIRCGYYVFPPVTYRDPNTNELSGFSIDMMNEIAGRAGMKVEWTEETNFNNWIPGLQTQRYDVACTPNWPDISQGRVVTFSVPMFFAGLYPMVRENDERFKTDDLERLNRDDVTFTAAEGDGLVNLIKARFPQAKLKVLSADGELTGFAMDVISGKADAFVIDRNGMVEFNRNNETKLKLIAPQQPVKVQAFNLAVERNELVLNYFLNTAIQELIYDGTMDRLLRKWEPEPGKTYLRVNQAYKDE